MNPAYKSCIEHDGASYTGLPFSGLFTLTLKRSQDRYNERLALKSKTYLSWECSHEEKYYIVKLKDEEVP